MDNIQFTTGRACTLTNISLHQFDGTLSQLTAVLSNCKNKNRPSYNFGVENSLRVEYVGLFDTPEAFPPSQLPVPAPVGVDPNPDCYTVSIGVAVGLNTFDTCNDSKYIYTDSLIANLVSLICSLVADNPTILVDGSHIFTALNELPDFPIATVLTKVADCLATPVVPVPNPAAVALCNKLGLFPVGSATTFFGKDASGNCVLSPVPAGAATTNVLSVSGQVLTSTVNGVVATATLPPPAPTTNVLSIAGDVITSTVDGVPSSITLPPVAPTTNVLSIAGNVVTSTVDGVPSSITLPPTTNVLSIAGNVITSTVDGIPSSITLPAPAPTTNVLSIAGNVVTSTVDGVPSSITLPPTTNALSIAGNVVTSTVDGVPSSITLPSVAPTTVTAGVNLTVPTSPTFDIVVDGVTVSVGLIEILDAFGIHQAYAFP